MFPCMTILSEVGSDGSGGFACAVGRTSVGRPGVRVPSLFCEIAETLICLATLRLSAVTSPSTRAVAPTYGVPSTTVLESRNMMFPFTSH